MKHPIELVRKFHEKFLCYIGNRPSLPSGEIRALRSRILEEEFNEYQNAERNNDIIEIADALADMTYVIMGTAIAYGIPLDKIFEEVHRSNMTKSGVRRDDGKILKGHSFEPPRIKELLNV